MCFLWGLWVYIGMGVGRRTLFGVGEVGEVDYAEEETDCVKDVLGSTRKVLWGWIEMRVLGFLLMLDFFLVWDNGLLLLHLFMAFFFLFWLSNRNRLFLWRRCLFLHFLMHLLHFLMLFLSKIAHTLCLSLLLWRFKPDTTLLNPLKMFLDNGVRIEPYDRCL